MSDNIESFEDIELESFEDLEVVDLEVEVKPLPKLKLKSFVIKIKELFK